MKNKSSWMCRTLVVAFLLTSAASSFAQANTRVRIRVPGLYVLDYYSLITVDIPATELAAALFPGHTVIVGGNAGARGRDAGAPADDVIVTLSNPVTFEGDAGIVPSGDAGALSSINLLISSAWVIRSNRPGTMAVSLGTGTSLSGENGGTISVTGVSTTPTAIAGDGLGTAQAQYGDVTLTLNMSNATRHGLYQNNNPTYVLQVNLN